MITVNALTRRYSHTVAVDQISFSVEKGQIVGFLGPNGAGKTTTMRMLTCFLPPTSGTAQVAGYDILEQSLEVRKRIGYLPETPPLYTDMETAEYLRFAGRLKGMSGQELDGRIEYVLGRCSVADVRNKLLGKLSKGYRQRVGLAAAILHNPDVLILDEPTAGLDPKQINETRDLIKDLAGEHTIILSTHILPEVEQTCQQVVIINKGKLVATDSVANLQSRARGVETTILEIAPAGGGLLDDRVPQVPRISGPGKPQTSVLDIDRIQRTLAQVPGVSRILLKEQRDNTAIFETESPRGALVRGDLARAVIAAGWDLNELRPGAMSLEEIFLRLTGGDVAQPQLVPPPAAPEEPQAHQEPNA